MLECRDCWSYSGFVLPLQVSPTRDLKTRLGHWLSAPTSFEVLALASFKKLFEGPRKWFLIATQLLHASGHQSLRTKSVLGNRICARSRSWEESDIIRHVGYVWRGYVGEAQYKFAVIVRTVTTSEAWLPVPFCTRFRSPTSIRLNHDIRAL